MYTNMKTSNRKKLWLKAPVNSGCIFILESINN